MPTSGNEAIAVAVEVSEHSLNVALSDGRTIAVPIAWYPRLAHATKREKRNWRLIGGGLGICWEDVDEDISIRSLLMGEASKENPASLTNWLKTRREHQSHSKIKPKSIKAVPCRPLGGGRFRGPPRGPR